MITFPTINNAQISVCFDAIAALYSRDKAKLLSAAEKATIGDPSPFISTPNNIDGQITVVKARVLRTADNYGQSLLIKWIEELYDELVTTGAIGVTDNDFIQATLIQLQDNSAIKYSASKKWNLRAELTVDGNSRLLELGIRGKDLPTKIIIQDYVLQYVQQAIIAYKNSRTAAALSLMSVALEGTLRDALAFKGYVYTFGSPAEDVFEIQDIHIHRDPLGYRVTFPNPMPSSHVDFLSLPGDPLFKAYKIKRFKKGPKIFLEIRQANDLLDYWSSNVVSTPAAIQIGGLGAALDIARNTANILSPIDLPLDLDNVIKAVRNNLIHLSGNAMLQNVSVDHLGHPVSLADFLNNKNRVFDAICTIGDAVNTLYDKLASGIL